jgi:sec-independent protein translocase protein TatA
MGDVAQGIKAFKKGMSEDEAAKAEPPKTEPVKTIDHQPGTATTDVKPAGDLKARADTEKRFEGSTS